MIWMNEVWKVWKYALGSFSDTKTSRYDNPVCAVRSIIFITYLATNCFITAGVIRHWNSMSKIDTQGMSGPVDPNFKGSVTPQEFKPAIINLVGYLLRLMLRKLRSLSMKCWMNVNIRREWKVLMIMWNHYHHHTLILKTSNIVLMNPNQSIKIGLNEQT